MSAIRSRAPFDRSSQRWDAVDRSRVVIPPGRVRLFQVLGVSCRFIILDELSEAPPGIKEFRTSDNGGRGAGEVAGRLVNVSMLPFDRDSAIGSLVVCRHE